MRMARIAGALAALICVAWPAGATPEPRLKPSPPPHFSQLLSQNDFARLREGLAAADSRRWSRVVTLESQITDVTARRILTWRRATSDPTISYGELQRARQDFLGWPDYAQILGVAEERLADARLRSDDVIAWFGDNEPVSGAGRIALAEAHLSAGRTEEGTAMLREAWRNYRFDTDLQDRIVASHGQRLTREDHEARVDYLLWVGHRSAARRLFPHISSGHRALADARIRLATRSRGVDGAIDRVPASLQEHPGLLFERAVWRRRARMTENAEPLIRQIPADVGSEAAARAIWRERNIHLRRAMDRGEYSAAYAMAAANGMERGVEFADAEFLAGWIALRNLNNPANALTHFERLERGVTTPISSARALYWQGRALEAMNQPAEALARYAAAAEHSTVYYGQLAAAELDGEHRNVTLPAIVEPTPEERAAFDARGPVRALRMLAELDELRLFRQFAYAYDDALVAPADFVMLSEIARDYGQDGVGVRAAKAALRQGVVVTDALYPVPSLPSLPSGAPEAAFVLALMRQESEFYPRAISGAGARGLMQLMPATARRTARSIGETYRRSWLTDDPDYNMRLGTAHLAELMREFQGSYILIACAYNAGPGRARQWIAEHGDPRRPGVDAVDWVEQIPFSETRDYVQRVLENTQVYRGRLNGGSTRIALDTDLRRGAY